MTPMTRQNYRDMMAKKFAKKRGATKKEKIVRVTAILVDTEWKELNHVTFSSRNGGKWTLDDLALEAKKANGGKPWVLGNGDILHITEEEL